MENINVIINRRLGGRLNVGILRERIRARRLRRRLNHRLYARLNTSLRIRLIERLHLTLKH